MAEFIDYDQILLDFVAVAKTVTGAAGEQFKHVDHDLDARDFIISNMPLLDVRVKRALPEPITNTTYYSDLTVEAEVCAFDMTSRAECATIRNHLVSALQRYLKDHPRFSGVVDTTFVGQADFGTGESKDEGAFVAGAVLQFHIKLYTE
jgi:hypothetical protein